MRLLLFNLMTDVDDPFLGFVPRWIEELAGHVDTIDVITMRAGHFEPPDNVTVYSVGKEKGYSEPRRVVEFYRILFDLLRRQRYDACFAHMMPLFAVMAAPLLRIRNIPVVLWYAHKSVTLVLQLATLLVDRAVTSTKEGYRIKSAKVKILGQGIETGRFVPGEEPPSPGFTILTVGRLSPIKRIELMIEAVVLLKQRNPEFAVCLRIVGGPLTDNDQVYAAELQQSPYLQEIVRFEGNVPFSEIVPYYQQADCFVNMCPTGAIDKVVLEAMSCGVLPIVVNRSFSDVLGAELAKTCIIEPNSELLAERLLLIASLPEAQRKEIGRQLRDVVIRDHALSALCEKILHEIEGVLKI